MLSSQEQQALSAIEEVGQGESVTAAEVIHYLGIAQQDTQKLLRRLVQGFLS